MYMFWIRNAMAIVVRADVLQASAWVRFLLVRNLNQIFVRSKVVKAGQILCEIRFTSFACHP
jgi:hypothetical protein